MCKRLPTVRTENTTFNSMFKLLTVISLASVTRQEVVTTVQGRIRGVTQDGFVSFIGIPYATINGAGGRFKQAGLAPNWSGIRESQYVHCTESSPVEDCLQLEVHMPTTGGAPWPVFVWVRGGSGRYNPGLLVQQGIVAVIVSHRLGPTGFLCLGEESIPGNAGVKDVIVALRWVRDNISAFKGNPNRVVVAGQSYGAAMVEALVISEMSRGLFHGAILQSGSVLSPWAFNYDAKLRGEFLKRMYPDDVDVTTTNLNILVHNSKQIDFSYYAFGMCAEKAFKHQEVLLSDPPYRLESSNNLRTVPLMIGYNSNEAYVFVSNLKRNNILKKVKRNLSLLLPEELKFLDDVEVNDVINQIRDLYFKHNNITMHALLSYHSDAYFVNHIYRSVRLHSTSHLPIYLYQFSHSTELGVSTVHGIKKYGAAHSDELAYLFKEKGNGIEGVNAMKSNNDGFIDSLGTFRIRKSPHIGHQFGADHEEFLSTSTHGHLGRYLR
ncbi:unnamed protein product [Diatraea saccharalis]|uniref:Carboxylesterase type B domain-containing protein n=1 Tax=Diatraea saccharalis TaxID=40085 RepID=A0A9N9R578_9NEOP|nr:unnamed protein product [Diatraea saccharalis]